MDDVPTLTTKRILAYVGRRSFDLGQQYFADGAVGHTQRLGDTIKASCQGSAPRPYRVRVTFSGNRIEQSDCTCPVGSGMCKHVAAVLISWQRTPETFGQTLAIDEKLARLDKPQLIKLLKQVLRRQPSLEQIVEALPLPGEAVTAQRYQKQADGILAAATGEWGEAADLVEQVLGIADAAEEFRKAGEFASAAAVYRGILASFLDHHQELNDENEACFDGIWECVSGIDDCLKQLSDQRQRLPLFRSLLDVIEFDGSLGGIGISDGAYAALMRHATLAERREVAGWIGKRPRDNPFVMALLADAIPDEEYLELCRQNGQRHELVERLLKRKRLDEAARELASAPEYELASLADLFVSHRQGELAEQCLRNRANRSQSPAIFEWLRERYVRRKDHAGALELARRQFQLVPLYETYCQVRSLGRKLEVWDTIRPELLGLLRRSADASIFVQVCLDEGLIDEALAAVRAEGGNGLAAQRGLVAKAAEETRPEAAIELYLAEAVTCIAQRQRQAYREACQYFKRARLLYEKLGQEAQWEQHMKAVRNRNKKRVAFLSELRRAGMG